MLRRIAGEFSGPATDVPPAERYAGDGATYTCAVRVRSRLGDSAVRLQSGPDSMTIDDKRVLHWRVPPEFEGDKANVILTVRDASSQEIVHSFSVAVH